MLAHVISVIEASKDVVTAIILCDVVPLGWRGLIEQDGGRGINAELSELVSRLDGTPLLVIHADLPLLAASDVECLLADPSEGWSIAPDHRCAGTNALALPDPHSFTFAFGPGSYARHLQLQQRRGRTVTLAGLAHDLDTPDDLELIRAHEASGVFSETGLQMPA